MWLLENFVISVLKKPKFYDKRGKILWNFRIYDKNPGFTGKINYRTICNLVTFVILCQNEHLQFYHKICFLEINKKDDIGG